MTKLSESIQQITIDLQLEDNTAPPVKRSHPSSAVALPQDGWTYTNGAAKTEGSSKTCKEAVSHYIQADLNLRDIKSLNPASQGTDSEQVIDQTVGAQESVASELLASGSILSSPGGHFTYRVIGACCRLFDRNELPWPCCRIQWRGKEPSWRRIGKRFVPDLATKRFPSYAVEILDHESSPEPVIVTVYWMPLSSSSRSWWYRRYVPTQSEIAAINISTLE